MVHVTKKFTTTRSFSTPFSLTDNNSSVCYAYLLFLQFKDLLFNFRNFTIYTVHALYQFFLRQLWRRSILVLPTRLTRNWRWWSLMLSSKSRVLSWRQEAGQNWTKSVILITCKWLFSKQTSMHELNKNFQLSTA